MSALAPTLEAFFTERLMRQRRASRHTIAAYRDTFRLLLAFAQERSGKAPSRLEFDDLDAPLIGAFLDHLEHARGNSPQSRNARLAAIHSLFRFAALRHPEHAALIARGLAIPPKRFDRAVVSHYRNVDGESVGLIKPAGIQRQRRYCRMRVGERMISLDDHLVATLLSQPRRFVFPHACHNDTLRS